jgi:CRP/FNR family transcriptional regulator
MWSFADAAVISDAPRYLAEATEDLLTGRRALRRAFMAMPYQAVVRDQSLIRDDGAAAPVFMLHRGIVHRSCTLPNGRRAILDLLLPGDIGGLEHIVLRRPEEEIFAASTVGFRSMSGTALRKLMADPSVALSVVALMAEARSRMDRHAAAVARLHARERIATLLLDIHDRLRRRDLIARPTFNLPLTQEQMADYLGLTMVHVNRTLRQMRQERLALIDHQVVIIMDLERLREVVHGLPSLVDEMDPGIPLGLTWDPAVSKQRQTPVA